MRGIKQSLENMYAMLIAIMSDKVDSFIFLLCQIWGNRKYLITILRLHLCFPANTNPTLPHFKWYPTNYLHFPLFHAFSIFIFQINEILLFINHHSPFPKQLRLHFTSWILIQFPQQIRFENGKDVHCAAAFMPEQSDGLAKTWHFLFLKFVFKKINAKQNFCVQNSSSNQVQYYSSSHWVLLFASNYLNSQKNQHRHQSLTIYSTVHWHSLRCLIC